MSISKHIQEHIVLGLYGVGAEIINVGSKGKFSTIAAAITYITGLVGVGVATGSESSLVGPLTMTLRNSGHPYIKDGDGDEDGFSSIVNQLVWYEHPTVANTIFAAYVSDDNAIIHVGGSEPFGGGSAFTDEEITLYAARPFVILLQAGETHICNEVVLPKFTSLIGEDASVTLDCDTGAFAINIDSAGGVNKIANISHAENGFLYTVQQTGFSAVIFMQDIGQLDIGAVHSCPLYGDFNRCGIQIRAAASIAGAPVPCAVNGQFRNGRINTNFNNQFLIYGPINANPVKTRHFNYKDNTFTAFINDWNSSFGVATPIALFTAQFGTSTGGLIELINNKFVVIDHQNTTANEAIDVTIVESGSAITVGRVIMRGNAVYFSPQNSGSTLTIAGGTAGAVLVDGDTVDIEDYGIAQGTAILMPNLFNIGTPNTGVVAVEEGDANSHTTTLTINQSAAVTLADNASLADGYLAYTFPAGAIIIESAYMSLDFDNAEHDAEACDAGLGTVIASGAVAVLGGTPTFENIITGQTGAIGTAVVKTAIPTAAVPFVIESGDAHTLFMNIAGAWADTAGVALDADITGTVVINWKFLT